MKCCDYGPRTILAIFFVTYEWAQLARVLHHTKVERLARDYNLFGQFVSYKKTKCYDYGPYICNSSFS